MHSIFQKIARSLNTFDTGEILRFLRKQQTFQFSAHDIIPNRVVFIAPTKVVRHYHVLAQLPATSFTRNKSTRARGENVFAMREKAQGNENPLRCSNIRHYGNLITTITTRFRCDI